MEGGLFCHDRIGRKFTLIGQTRENFKQEPNTRMHWYYWL